MVDVSDTRRRYGRLYILLCQITIEIRQKAMNSLIWTNIFIISVFRFSTSSTHLPLLDEFICSNP